MNLKVTINKDLPFNKSYILCIYERTTTYKCIKRTRKYQLSKNRYPIRVPTKKLSFFDFPILIQLETNCSIHLEVHKVIEIQNKNSRFHIRVAGVLIHQGRVLLHRKKQEDFWALPGGRAEMNEATPITIVREMEEELGVKIEVDRLLWIAETFIEYHGHVHELGMYYLIRTKEDHELLHMDLFEGVGEAGHLIFEWFPVEKLDELPLYPSLLRKGIQTLPLTPMHVIVHE